MGFDGSWADAAHLFDSARLSSLKAEKRPAPKGCRWYRQEQGKTFLAILWDGTRQLPRRIESGTRDGARFSRLEVTPEPLPRTLPWNRLEGFQRKDYVDLLD